jgi:hypothetical protein
MAGRGRGAVIPAWMKAQGIDQAPAAPGGRYQELKVKSIRF